jgi:cytochrome c oxidase cbb3-type subunit 2
LRTDGDAARAEFVPASSAWRGAALIACTYVYFLIFAEFGFLKSLDQGNIGGNSLRLVMGAMAAGGILASLFAARQGTETASRRLRLALLGCAAAAGFSLLPVHLAGFVFVALLIGLSLGALTVTLVAHLPLWIGARQPLLGVALGTGVGYFICNIPAVFTASPRQIALLAIAACVCGLVASSPIGGPDPARVVPLRRETIPFGLALVWFTALVWLDSAAFLIIQNSPALKSGTWEGSAALWRTGIVHLIAALAGARLLIRRGTSWTLLLAFACLAGACLLLLDPSRSDPAAILYPAGVSLYSVALVAFPSFLMQGISQEQRSRRAGWIYAVAGWIGSAMGIGMAQHLHRIPAWFVAAAAVLFFMPVALRYDRTYWREAAAVGLVLAAAWGIEGVLARHDRPANSAATMPPSAIERGRRVYISEGCINCHSQFVRPHSPDVELWGPATSLEAIRHQYPPLIGNRRQGPDLSNVGARRSPLWLRIHLIDPRAVSYGSFMPNYEYLFHGQRGDDLVAYLTSLRREDGLRHIAQESASWRPSKAAIASAGALDGEKLFQNYCATCHDPHGYVRTRWADDFKVLRSNLATAGLRNVPGQKGPAELRIRLAQIIAKFGLPGTDMPGHEYLPEAQLAAIANYVATLRGQ